MMTHRQLTTATRKNKAEWALDEAAHYSDNKSSPAREEDIVLETTPSGEEERNHYADNIVHAFIKREEKVEFGMPKAASLVFPALDAASTNGKNPNLLKKTSNYVENRYDRRAQAKAVSYVS